MTYIHQAHPLSPELTTEPVFLLYGTECCTLCEQAQAMLSHFAEGFAFELQLVDIAEDDDLETRFAERIPVLASGAHELDWPFSFTELVQFWQQAKRELSHD